MTKRLIVGMWRGQYFFYSTGSVRKLARDWTTGRSRGVVTQWSCQGLPKWWNLVNVAFCLKNYLKAVNMEVQRRLWFSLLSLIPFYFFFCFVFQFCFCFYQVFITLFLLIRWHWPCSYVRTGAQVATPCAKSIFSDVMSSLVICLPCVHNLSCMIHLISAKRGSVSNKINYCDTHCSGLLIPTTHVLWP